MGWLAYLGDVVVNKKSKINSRGGSDASSSHSN